jgi:hypothetical protein
VGIFIKGNAGGGNTGGKGGPAIPKVGRNIIKIEKSPATITSIFIFCGVYHKYALMIIPDIFLS